MSSRHTRTRTWSVPTSPRSPYKLQDELELIAEFEGRLWNRAAQIEFAQKLADSEFYRGSVSANNPDFAARDRVNRAPRTFGFIRLGRNRPVEVTAAGRELIQGRALEDLFLRQLLKWQYPSPNHDNQDYRELFRIRPFLEMLRLVRELDGLNKIELALVGVPLTDYRNYGEAKRSIQVFRQQYMALTSRVDRATLVQNSLIVRVRAIYPDDIAAGRIGTRESQAGGDSLTNLLNVKARNLRDYSDAALRYFLATGVFTISGSARVYRLKILPERLAEVDALLQTTPREPVRYDDAEAFYKYFGDPETPRLPSDELPVLRDRLRVLFDQLPQRVQQASGLNQSCFQVENSPIALKDFERQLRALAEADALAQQQAGLQQAQAVDEILDVFTQIRKNEVPDRPLFFEWNTWRALSALDDGNIENNFEVDRLGQPRKQAPGGAADIKCEYADFHLAVEVTLSYGATQYKMEGEPVNRHVGLLQRVVRDSGDTRPVYGLFIADRLAPTVINHFFGLQAVRSKEFAGPVSVIPLNLDDFMAMVKAARNQLPLPSLYLRDFFAEARRLAQASEDEEQWYASVKALITGWLLPSAQN